MAMAYLYLKHTHVLLVVVSLLLFNARFFMRLLSGDASSMPKWAKVVPHINDSLLLLSGLGLIHLTHYIPFATAPWLGVKLSLLGAYVVLGYQALKAPRRKLAWLWWLAAMLSVTVMVLLARFKPVMSLTTALQLVLALLLLFIAIKAVRQRVANAKSQ